MRTKTRGAPAPKHTRDSEPMPPSFLELMKMKRKRTEYYYNEDDDDEVTLKVDVKFAEDIDTENVGSEGDRRTYQVYGWVSPGTQFKTHEVLGLPNPAWRMIYSMRMRKPWSRDLYLEVVRTGSKSDPGTSKGLKVMGRTRIPLPRVMNKVKGGRIGLVRPKGEGCVAGGYLAVTMEITKRKYY